MTRRQGIVLACLACGGLPAFGRCETRNVTPSAISHVQAIGTTDPQTFSVSLSGKPARNPSAPRPVMFMAGVGIALGLLIRSVKAHRLP